MKGTKQVDAAATLPTASWEALVGPLRPFLHQVTERLHAEVADFDPAISQFVQYALASQGKRLRPTLVGWSGRLQGKLSDDHVTLAAIVEMVHLATLVHDDILDGAQLRRGRPTLAEHWGSNMAVLVGDCLFSQALKLAASFPTTEVCRASAIASKNVCTGEIIQTTQRGNFHLTREEYYKVIRLKTAELFAVSCEMGARVSGASKEIAAQVRALGEEIGMAYQLYDDALDVFGHESTAGKTLGTDLWTGQLTLPLLIALEQGTEQDRAWLMTHLPEWRPELNGALLVLLRRNAVLEKTQAEIGLYLDRAVKMAQSLPGGDGVDGIRGLIDLLTSQIAALGSSTETIDAVVAS